MVTSKKPASGKQLKILFVASEVEGLVKTGGLADVAKSLPSALKEMGHDVRIVMPLYQKVAGADQADSLLDTELYVASQPTPVSYQVKQLQSGKVTVFAVDAPQYFERPELYAENNQAYSDNGERFAFFSAASLDLCEKKLVSSRILSTVTIGILAWFPSCFVLGMLTMRFFCSD